MKCPTWLVNRLKWSTIAQHGQKPPNMVNPSTPNNSHHQGGCDGVYIRAFHHVLKGVFHTQNVGHHKKQCDHVDRPSDHVDHGPRSD